MATLNRNPPLPAARRNFLSVFRLHSPARADELVRRAGRAYHAAIPTLKTGERALRLSDSSVHDLSRSGGPLAVLLAQLDCLAADTHARPGALVAEAAITLAESLMTLDTAELVRRFWSLLEDEAEAEGAENGVTATFGRDGNMEALEDAMQREVSAQIELIAVCRELRRRNVDPRTWGKA